MQVKKICITLILSCTTLSAAAVESVKTGFESYRWREYVSNQNNVSPIETGTRLAATFNWREDGDRGLLWGYQGKLYFGRVRYDTFMQQSGEAVSTHTVYSGSSQEIQLMHRQDLGRVKFDYVSGFGLDGWQRMIATQGAYQTEEYRILFVRGGINIDQPVKSDEFHGGGGVKYPVWTSEDANLDTAGFTSNPKLSPGKSISLYAELGYRISNYFDLVGYYDSWRFKESPRVKAATADGRMYEIWQPKSSMDTVGLRMMYAF